MRLKLAPGVLEVVEAASATASTAVLLVTVSVSVLLAVALCSELVAVSTIRALWPASAAAGIIPVSSRPSDWPDARVTLPPCAITGSPGSALPLALRSCTTCGFAGAKPAPAGRVTVME